MKGLMKFQLRSICGSQVINFQMFSGPWSSHELGHFGGFLGLNSPKNASILLKLAPEVDLKERNTVLKFLGEIPSFKPKNQLFVVFLVTPCPKRGTQIFCQKKGLMEIHNCAKFHLHSLYGSQVIQFKSFWYQEKG